MSHSAVGCSRRFVFGAHPASRRVVEQRSVACTAKGRMIMVWRGPRKRGGGGKVAVAACQRAYEGVRQRRKSEKRALAYLSLPHFTTRLMCLLFALDDPRRCFACTYATLARTRRRGTNAGRRSEGRGMQQMWRGRTEVDGREQDGRRGRSGARAGATLRGMVGRREKSGVDGRRCCPGRQCGSQSHRQRTLNSCRWTRAGRPW